jgi:hypothetical protein
MKTTGLAQTPVMKHFGLRGARICGWIWFSAMYLALIAIVAGWWMVWPELPGGWRRMVAGGIVGTLVVLAISLLIRMRLKYLAEIDQFEAGQKRGGQ